MAAKREHFRSGLEYKIALDLEDKGVAYEYENLKIGYQDGVEIVKPCLFCSGEIPFDRHGSAKYCSLVCRKNHERIKNKKPKEMAHCLKCGGKIPYEMRSDAKYCGDRCKGAAEKKRYCDNNPAYVKKQRKLVREIRHMKEFGHTRYIDNPMANSRDKYAQARSLGYRSMLEVSIAEDLKSKGVDFKYENLKISYLKPESTYVADFELPNGIIVEGKGKFDSADRSKHLLIKEQHPELDIRFVFSNSRSKLYKGSKNTYGDWCDKWGFKYSDKLIPTDWIEE